MSSYRRLGVRNLSDSDDIMSKYRDRGNITTDIEGVRGEDDVYKAI